MVRLAAYYKNLEAGLCPSCGGKRDNGWLHCTVCLLKNKERKANTPVGKRRAWRNDWRQRVKRGNRCHKCGGHPDDPRFVTCTRCRRKRREQRRRRKELEIALPRENHSSPDETPQNAILGGVGLKGDISYGGNLR
jgi:hypothetical protein